MQLLFLGLLLELLYVLSGISRVYLEFSRPNWNLQEFNRRSMVPDNNCNNYMVDRNWRLGE